MESTCAPGAEWLNTTSPIAFLLVLSQMKEKNGKLTDLEDRMSAEKALNNYGDLRTKVSKLIVWVNDLYSWDR